jgi:TRAP-type C4-dicarboxylate transport system substrate-binding protein
MTRSILLNCIEPFVPAIDITMGDEVPVYRRASLSRTAATVVALSLTAISASAGAREFRAADTQSEDDPTVEALRYTGRMIAERSGCRHEIRVYHSRQFGEEKETIEQTRAGAIGLAFYDSGARAIYNRVRPVRSIADIGGLRLRVQQSEAMSDMIRTLGADPVGLPFGQVLTGLASRLIAKAQRDPAAAQPIERIRMVE